MERQLKYLILLNRVLWILVPCLLLSILLFYFAAVPVTKNSAKTPHMVSEAGMTNPLWQAPDTAGLSFDEVDKLIRYGRNLVVHTSDYLGPIGKVKQISNGMNCQNCHLGAGTVPYGNNFGAVASTYPLFRHRSGTLEEIEDRVNDCFERSLNGERLAVDSKEMKAMVAYIKWLGKDNEKIKKLSGFGLMPIPPMDRSADPVKGKTVYAKKCAQCHGQEGEGLMREDGIEWIYPPLYGPESYNTGAGIYRISKFAAYVKANMPLGASFEEPLLSDEESWDIAAFVNSMPRPEKDISKDWPDIAKKPFDHPFGPYADSFPESQHKLGPFPPNSGF